MKKIYPFNLFFSLLISLMATAQNPTKVLFIGNSITYYNNMPQTFESIANSLGDTTEVTVHAPGGTGIIDHVNNPAVYDLFRQGDWDFVVLQPGSGESPGYSEPKEQTLQRIQKLQDSIYHYNACAKILIYQIPYGVYGNSQQDINSYNATMDLILANCEYWADEAQIFFAPAGEAVRTAWNNDPNTLLWVSTNNVHPNEKGSYLIACSIYASIFQKASSGNNVTGNLSPQEAAAYQQLADDTVLNHLPDWRINVYYQHTAFDYTLNQSEVTFNNLSQNYDSLLWDFGDGNTSAEVSPVHNYTQTGTYEASLTTYKDGCAETQTQSIEITSLGIAGSAETKLCRIYPNPFAEYIYIENYSGKDIRMYNLQGQSYDLKKATDTSPKGIRIHTAQLASGWYILQTGDTFIKLFKL